MEEVYLPPYQIVPIIKDKRFFPFTPFTGEDFFPDIAIVKRVYPVRNMVYIFLISSRIIGTQLLCNILLEILFRKIIFAKDTMYNIT